MLLSFELSLPGLEKAVERYQATFTGMGNPYLVTLESLRPRGFA